LNEYSIGQKLVLFQWSPGKGIKFLENKKHRKGYIIYTLKFEYASIDKLF